VHSMVKDYVSPIAGLVLIGFSIYILLWSLDLMIRRDVPSSLLAVLIGFVALTGGVSLIRTWSLERAASRTGGEGGEGSVGGSNNSSH
jgi:hypothetical protein